MGDSAERVSGRPEPGRGTPSGGPLPPLHDVRVLDITRIVSGPLCTRILGQLGAEVVRVDKPGGDVLSSVPPFIRPDGTTGNRAEGPDDISVSYAKHNVGKRSVSLDIFSEPGQARLRELALGADVLVENFRPSVLTSLGLGHEELRSAHPSLVYCSITGYGHSGPYRDRHGMDLLVQAASGVMAMTGFADGPPVKAGVWLGDHVPAVYAVVGILAALRRRDQTGYGDFVDVSMYDVLTAMLWDAPLDVWQRQGRKPRTGNSDPRGAPINAYPTHDGWIALLIMDDERFAALCNEIGRPELAGAGRGVAARAANAEAIDAAVASWTAELTTASALERLTALDCPAAAVNAPWHGQDDPHVASRGVLGRLAHGGTHRASEFQAARLPITFEESVVPVGVACEPLGHSTDSYI